MRGIIPVLVVAMIGISGTADAAERERSTRSAKATAKSNSSAPTQRLYDDRDAAGWYPRDSRQLKFGSRIWWEQMEAEGRSGRRSSQ